ncbi:TIGR00341 family protein [Rhodoblastus acidophilus]|uniref:TIGR00341 family protein n=1 Tax=Candidatus Rhodoblastus alkanivorans TaxID=2954117 RepID=A0ABS9Z2D7_9HYPH|nr:TIGR00341 family protein [Candidatus Rhodoblastus alkanivorans]MCI4677476.1 TIGR00341 family protein [Candidatus Rhodoblastus alkanivorans]MCI4681835.1 TIGR00341 family protein [Candidatus Rhodoblastus alkanivorans]MDI4642885.1 TIGR00341 family protein [Rhodoblastus acidophilus]
MFKVIEVATPEKRVHAVVAVAEEMKAADVQIGPPFEDGRRPIRLLVGEIDRQALIDRLHGALGKSENWRITMLPTDAAIPDEPEPEKTAPEEEDEEAKKDEQARASREELYHLIENGARLDANFILLVFLSTLVATVGLERNDVAVVIGAMVIAPLLGPNVAFAFASAIGDQKLMLSAASASAVGVVTAIAIATILALLAAADPSTPGLMARTSIDYANIILAIASGTAAALSVTTGLSSTLVGVMVAVALLPPAATLGIMLAARRFDLAGGAAMLLGANMASVNLAAQLVFMAKGVRPHGGGDQCGDVGPPALGADRLHRPAPIVLLTRRGRTIHAHMRCQAWVI